MTGFGMSSGTTDNYRVTVEIKSLNSKFFEMTLKVPRAYMRYENHLRTTLTKEIERGKIMVLMNVELLDLSKASLNINHQVMVGYIHDLQKIQQQYGLQPLSMDTLLNLPNVQKEEISEGDEEEWDLIFRTTMEAAKALIENRKEEGKSLEQDFLFRVAEIEKALEEVQQLAPQRMAAVRDKMGATVEEIRKRIEIDSNRFEQEMIFYIERLDINEEIVRLTQHIQFFREVLKGKNSNGKQLNFIAQEMGREINTIGSKANDAPMQRVVVKMKDELEKIKEQTMNVV